MRGEVGINRSLRLLQMYYLTQEGRGGGRWRAEGGEEDGEREGPVSDRK